MATLQEPMVDLVSMCESCHNSVREKSQVPIPAFLGINEFEGGCDNRNVFAKMQAEADHRKPANPSNQPVPFGNE